MMYCDKLDKGSIFAATEKYRSVVREAISNHQAERNSSFFEDKIVNNAPMEITGPFAGYTALHMACMGEDTEYVRLLLEDYHANVNVVADDGAQPIHLACLLLKISMSGEGELIDILLRAGANVDAEIGQELFTKYFQINYNKAVWCNNFGNKMTLLTFLLIYNHNFSFMQSLIAGKANLKVKSLKNKTLLMYAIENKKYSIASLLIKEVQDHEWINARDSDGYSAIHYLLHRKNLYNDQYYDNHQELMDDKFGAELIFDLLKAGADVNAIVNGDPNTLLLNSAARKHFPLILDNLLPYHHYTSQSRALHVILRPRKTRQTKFSIIKKITCIKLILKDLIYRLTFGLFVPEGEKILMDKLIAEHIHFREYAHTYEKNIIQGELKTRVLKYDDKSITYYDFIKSCFNDKQLRLIVKNKSLMDAFENTFPKPDVPSFTEKFLYNDDCISRALKSSDNADYFFFQKQMSIRIEKALRRPEQLKALGRVENLRNAIPLPYELVLMVVEYFNYQDFKNFIQAFYL